MYTGRGQVPEYDAFNGTKAEVIDLLNENVDCDLYATLPVETYNTLGGKVNNEFLFLKEPDCYIVGQDTPTDYEKCSSFKVHQTNITNAMLAKTDEYIALSLSLEISVRACVTQKRTVVNK